MDRKNDSRITVSSKSNPIVYETPGNGYETLPGDDNYGSSRLTYELAITHF